MGNALIGKGSWKATSSPINYLTIMNDWVTMWDSLFSTLIDGLFDCHIRFQFEKLLSLTRWMGIKTFCCYRCHVSPRVKMKNFILFWKRLLLLIVINGTEVWYRQLYVLMRRCNQSDKRLDTGSEWSILPTVSIWTIDRTTDQPEDLYFESPVWSPTVP